MEEEKRVVQPDEISFSSNSNSDGSRRKKGYDRRGRSPRGLSNSPKRSRSRSEMDPEEAADLDDRERRKQQRRATKEGSPEQYRPYREKSRGGNYRRTKKIQVPSFRDRLYTRKDFELYQSSRFDRNELAEAYNDYVQEYKKD